jgi:hypothetical protein
MLSGSCSMGLKLLDSTDEACVLSKMENAWFPLKNQDSSRRGEFEYVMCFPEDEKIHSLSMTAFQRNLYVRSTSFS